MTGTHFTHFYSNIISKILRSLFSASQTASQAASSDLYDETSFRSVVPFTANCQRRKTRDLWRWSVSNAGVDNYLTLPMNYFILFPNVFLWTNYKQFATQTDKIIYTYNFTKPTIHTSAYRSHRSQFCKLWSLVCTLWHLAQAESELYFFKYFIFRLWVQALLTIFRELAEVMFY